MRDRRTLLKGIAGVGVGLLLPPTLAENAEAARRYWSLDRTMLAPAGRDLGRIADSMAPWLPGGDWRLIMHDPEQLGRAVYRATFYNIVDFRAAWSEVDLQDVQRYGGDARIMATIRAGNEVHDQWPDAERATVLSSMLEIARRA